MKIIVFPEGAGKFKLLVKHTQPWEGPSHLVKGLTRENLRQEAQKTIEAVWEDGPFGHRGTQP